VRWLSWASILVFGFAALAAIRLAVAETVFRRDTVAAVKLAISIEGSAPSAEFEERLAELDPEHAREALQRAVAANSQSSRAWIGLGLLQETTGNSSAEDSLLQAARVDHQYLPAWTLANFYFRRGDEEQFWPWANRAARLTYDDFRPLLRLCDQFERDPAKLLAHLGEQPRIRPSYLNFLIGESRLDAAQQVARGMSADRANDPHLIDLADRQIRAGNAESAIELWNIGAGFLPIDPSAGRILTNGDFAKAPLNLGFDWRLGQVEGVAQSWRPSELTFRFSGSQPETCVLLEQTICLAPRHFRLRFDYMTGEAPAAGVRWSLNDHDGPCIDPSAEWKEGVFDMPRGNGLARLKLFYRRDPGTTRSEGMIEIRNVRLETSL
jgi:hypothetical protein